MTPKVSCVLTVGDDVIVNLGRCGLDGRMDDGWMEDEWMDDGWIMDELKFMGK